MQARLATAHSKQTRELALNLLKLDGGPMTPVAASNGTLNPAAAGGSTPPNAGGRSSKGHVLVSGPGSRIGDWPAFFVTTLRPGRLGSWTPGLLDSVDIGSGMRSLRWYHALVHARRRL